MHYKKLLILTTSFFSSSYTFGASQSNGGNIITCGERHISSDIKDLWHKKVRFFKTIQPPSYTDKPIVGFCLYEEVCGYATGYAVLVLHKKHYNNFLKKWCHSEQPHVVYPFPTSTEGQQPPLTFGPLHRTSDGKPTLGDHTDCTIPITAPETFFDIPKTDNQLHLKVLNHTPQQGSSKFAWEIIAKKAPPRLEPLVHALEEHKTPMSV